MFPRRDIARKKSDSACAELKMWILFASLLFFPFVFLLFAGLVIAILFCKTASGSLFLKKVEIFTRKGCAFCEFYFLSSHRHKKRFFKRLSKLCLSVLMRPKFGKLMNISGCLHKVGVWPEPCKKSVCKDHRNTLYR